MFHVDNGGGKGSNSNRKVHSRSSSSEMVVPTSNWEGCTNGSGLGTPFGNASTEAVIKEDRVCNGFGRLVSHEGTKYVSSCNSMKAKRNP